MRHRITCGLLLCLAVLASAAALKGGDPLTVETILKRMEQARDQNRARFRSYVVTRNYTLFGKERNESKAEVTAEVSFVPPSSKQFTIQKSTGSGLGERLVRRMLEGETEIVEDYGSTDISPENYDFRFVGEQLLNNQRCYVIELLPKRKHRALIHGNVWVDVNSYLLHRLEGEPAKSPSWWLRNVRIAFTYSEVAGMWLQTASEYTTNVRIFGRYAMISRDVRYEPAGLASAGPAMPLRPNGRAKPEQPPDAKPPQANCADATAGAAKQTRAAGIERQEVTPCN